jgi:hypothetical protein
MTESFVGNFGDIKPAEGRQTKLLAPHTVTSRVGQLQQNFTWLALALHRQ